MTGHAWWAVRSGDVAFCTQAQTRLNTEKILALIEAAGWPENAERAFIACLARISPGELFGFFAEIAYQLQHGQVMRLPACHLESPLTCPTNFFLIGTMDAATFDWSDPVLLSQTSVIHWSSAIAQSPAGHDHDKVERTLPGDWLHHAIRNAPAARRKLACLLPRPCRTLHSLRRDLAPHQATLAAAITRDLAIYLANAWSGDGTGLYDPDPQRNLLVALDFALVQIVLLRQRAALCASAGLRRRLTEALSGEFPRATAYLNGLEA